MVRWHYQLNVHEFEQAPGDDEGQGSLVCCSPCSHEESDRTDQLNNNKKTKDKCWGKIAVSKIRLNSAVRVHTSNRDNIGIIKDHTDIWKIVKHAPDYR